MEWLGSTLGSLLVTLFFIALIGLLGYLLGAIKVKGISLGTAGVLIIAIIFGVILFFSGTKDDKGQLLEVAFNIGESKITIWSASIKSLFSFVSNLGTAMFVGAVGLIAGPKFFRSFNRKTSAYLAMGVIVILVGEAMNILIAAIDPNMSLSMSTGLLSGALTSTPGLGAVKDAAGSISNELENQAVAGYGIAYLFGVVGVVLFVQLLPKILKIDIAKERESFVAANAIAIKQSNKKRFQVEPLGIFIFFVTIVVGMLIGSIKIPINASGSYFSLGTSGGALIAGLVIGHFGHVGPMDFTPPKATLNLMRELGLVFFLIGAGVPGGINFVTYFNPLYLVYGIIYTTVPMVIGFIFAKFVFKLSIFNNLGSITGGMTSTPALGSLIQVAGTDEVASAYAATYPVALVLLVILNNLLVTLLPML